MTRTAQRRSRRRGRGAYRGFTWLRAVLHPLLFVAPPALLCIVLAHRPNSDLGDVSWGFLVIPVCALASLVATVMMVARSPLPAVERVAVGCLGLVASAAALVLGFMAWSDAATVACHGTYECPF